MKLNAELSKALGLPPNCTKAVLTLEAGELPKLWVETLHWGSEIPAAARDDALAPGVAARIQKVAFMLRMEPFEPVALSHAPST